MSTYRASGWGAENEPASESSPDHSHPAAPYGPPAQSTYPGSGYPQTNPQSSYQPMGQPAVGQPAMGQPAMGQPAMGQPSAAGYATSARPLPYGQPPPYGASPGAPFGQRQPADPGYPY